MRTNRFALALVVCLRTIAAVESLATLAVFMPHAWMDACHRGLGLGTLPAQPILIYLTRSLSALYAAQAGLIWLVSGDVRRYAPVVLYLGLAFLVFGAVVLGIDCHAGLPWFWICGEGPVLMLIGSLILVLLWRSGPSDCYRAARE
jgi:hypothetical protein